MATSLTHSAVGTPRFRLLIVIVPLSWVMVGATNWAVNETWLTGPRRFWVGLAAKAVMKKLYGASRSSV